MSTNSLNQLLALSSSSSSVRERNLFMQDCMNRNMIPVWSDSGTVLMGYKQNQNDYVFLSYNGTEDKPYEIRLLQTFSVIKRSYIPFI